MGYDKTFDLALIKTEITPDYVFGGWSGQTLTPGDRIYAIGSPAGLEKTITSGIISAMGRQAPAGGRLHAGRRSPESRATAADPFSTSGVT